MSCYVIYYENGAKHMRPVLTRKEYLQLRDSEQNRKADKKHMAQMNYSCLPNDDGTLRGSTRMSTTVGMDVDLPESEAQDASKLQEVQDKILSLKHELGLLMLEKSATKGFHIVFRRRPELSQEENLKWASELLGVQYDKGAKDITRVFFTPPSDKMLFLDNSLFENEIADFVNEKLKAESEKSAPIVESKNVQDISTPLPITGKGKSPQGEGKGVLEAVEGVYQGIPYSSIISKWWEMYNDGQTPVKSNRDVLTFELAVNLRHICGFDREQLDRVIPCYDGFSEQQKLKCIDSALAEKRTQMPRRLKDVLIALRRENINDTQMQNAFDDIDTQDDLFYYNRLSRMPMGVRDSIESAGKKLAMPVLAAICPVIGMLATGVKLDVHGRMCGLDLISFICGDAGSGKGDIDPIVEAWLAEVRAQENVYHQFEKEWRKKKRAAANSKAQPEEITYDVRIQTFNNTVANLAERLENAQGRHSFSFTPEADVVAKSWKSTMSDYSVMLRCAFDETRYDREAKSADAATVHIDKLLWNVVMCGTPDALYRLITNYTDGLLSRIFIARTPDNTFAKQEDSNPCLTDHAAERIRQVAHLLPLMQGEVVLPKLEKAGRRWCEDIRLEAIKNFDKVLARDRFRDCVIAQRMMGCIMLAQVCEKLIGEFGVAGAEERLKREPQMWIPYMMKAQTPTMLANFDAIADSLLDNDMFYFHDRIAAAMHQAPDASTGIAYRRKGSNDNIYARLADEFSFEQALQQTFAVKGTDTKRGTVHQMLKNWRNQGLVVKTDSGRYKKVKM